VNRIDTSVDTTTLPRPVGAAVRRYLGLVDRLLPQRIVGFWVVGSTALGAWRPNRSDIDFVAALDRPLDATELRRLRVAFLLAGIRSGLPDLARGNLALPGVCNGVFVDRADLTEPVTAIVPVASHAGHDFHAGRGFDVNPVVWRTFADHGITVRGPRPSELGLQPEPGKIVEWNRANLEGYWRPQGERLVAGDEGYRLRLTPRWISAWCVTGAPRLHHTIATGGVISKEAAAEYARDTFGPEWHPLVDDAIAYRHGRPSPDPTRFSDRKVRGEATGRFVLTVVDDARSLPDRGC
jgi:hypothetical protein